LSFNGNKRVLVIWNPTAGGAKRRRVQAVLDLLGQAGCELVLQPTAARGDALRFAAAARIAQHDVLLVAGGDGTINEVANGLGEQAPPLALCPLGTANVFASEIGQGAAPAAVAATVLDGRVASMHAGLANGYRFLQMVGAGFDAHVVAGINTALKRRIGKGAYVWQTLVQARRGTWPRYRVTIDGGVHDCASVIVARGRFYAGRFVVAPAARWDAPDLQVVLLPRGGMAGVALYGTALLLNAIPRLPEVRVLPARDVVVEGPMDDPVQGDGDVVACLPLRVAVDERPLRLVLPPER